MKEYIDRALSNVLFEDSTDVFPFNKEKYKEIDLSTIIELDRDMENLSPDEIQAKHDFRHTFSTSLKRDNSPREVVQIDPRLDLYYLSLAIRMAQQCEPTRSPAVHSYRFSQGNSYGGVFKINRNHTSFVGAINAFLAYRDALLEQGRIRAYPKNIYSQSREQIKRYDCVIRLDINNFYGSICRGTLKTVVESYPEANKVLKILDLIGCEGLPVGGNASRILAEIVLDRVDKFIERKGVLFYRFVDDICLFVERESAQEVLTSITQKLNSMGLSLNPNKIQMEDTQNFKMEAMTHHPNNLVYGFNMEWHLRHQTKVDDTLYSTLSHAWYHLKLRNEAPDDFLNIAIDRSAFQLAGDPHRFVKICNYITELWEYITPPNRALILATLKSLPSGNDKIFQCGVNRLCFDELLRKS